MYQVGCSGIQGIYTRLQVEQCPTGICALCYIWNVFGVMVLQRSILSWRGQSASRYMCIVLYIERCHEMCQVWCCGIAGIYAWLGGQFAMDICALYYIWVIWCNGFTDYASLEVGGVNLPWVYVYCAIYELVWCNGFPDTYDWLEEREWHQSAIGICALCYIYICQ